MVEKYNRIDLDRYRAAQILREISLTIQSGSPAYMDAHSSQEFQNRDFSNKNKLDSYEQSLQLLQEQASLYADPNQIPAQLKMDIRVLSSELEKLRTLTKTTNSN